MLSRDKTKLYIKKRQIPEWLVLLVIILPFAYGFLFSLLNATALIKYSIDVFWLSLFAIMLLRKSITLSKRIIPFVVLIAIFLIYSFTIYLFNFQSPFYYLWGVRNNFRFYVVFFAVISFLSYDDADMIFKLFDFLFWINFAVSLLQYFVFGYKQDSLGGIFGVEHGANAYTIIFLLIVLSKSLISYMSKQESMLSCFSKCGAALFIVALAELKAFFVFFFIVVILCSILTSFSWRKLIIIMLLAIAAILASALLTSLFGFESSLSLQNIWKLATQKNYSAQGTINRLSAIPVLAKTLLTDFWNRLFGLGLGNCDTSSFKIFNTPFYENYGHLRYSWFSCAILFLETGYLGIMIFLAFFVFCYLLSNKQLKSGSCKPIYCQLAMVMSVMCVIFTFYNSSLRTEAAYMLYFVLALPFIDNKNSESANTAI